MVNHGFHHGTMVKWIWSTKFGIGHRAQIQMDLNIADGYIVGWWPWLTISWFTAFLYNIKSFANQTMFFFNHHFLSKAAIWENPATWWFMVSFKKSIAKPWSTLVNHGWLTNHGQPWSTFKYLFLPFLSENPMAEPWPAKLRLVQVPSILVENRYKVLLLTWDSFKMQTGVQWLHKGKFQSLQTCIKVSICVKPIFFV